jgi:hypothetical protein
VARFAFAAGIFFKLLVFMATSTGFQASAEHLIYTHL